MFHQALWKTKKSPMPKFSLTIFPQVKIQMSLFRQKNLIGGSLSVSNKASSLLVSCFSDLGELHKVLQRWNFFVTHALNTPRVLFTTPPLGEKIYFSFLSRFFAQEYVSCSFRKRRTNHLGIHEESFQAFSSFHSKDCWDTIMDVPTLMLKSGLIFNLQNRRLDSSANLREVRLELQSNLSFFEFIIRPLKAWCIIWPFLVHTWMCCLQNSILYCALFWENILDFDSEME